MSKSNDYLIEQMESEIDRMEEQTMVENEKELGNNLKPKRGGRYEVYRLQS